MAAEAGWRSTVTCCRRDGTCSRAACTRPSTAATPSAISAGYPWRIQPGSARPPSQRDRDALPPRLCCCMSFPSFATGGRRCASPPSSTGSADAFSHAVVAMDGRLEARALLDPELDIHFPESA